MFKLSAHTDGNVQFTKSDGSHTKIVGLDEHVSMVYTVKCVVFLSDDTIAGSTNKGDAHKDHQVTSTSSPLAAGDLVLLVTPNTTSVSGIYTVQASGDPTRLDSGYNKAGATVDNYEVVVLIDDPDYIHQGKRFRVQHSSSHTKHQVGTDTVVVTEVKQSPNSELQINVDDGYGAFELRALAPESDLNSEGDILRSTTSDTMIYNTFTVREESGLTTESSDKHFMKYDVTDGLLTLNCGDQDSHALKVMHQNGGTDVTIGTDGIITGVAYSGSDERLKKDITPIQSSDALAAITSLKGVEFSYKADPKQHKHLGFIAQEVSQVYPQLVRESNDGFLAINYPFLTAPLVEAIKAQQSIIDDLKSRIEALES